MASVLIVGASRGLGYEFARQYAGDGARVTGTCRRPEDAARLRALGVRPLLLDVLNLGTLPAAIEGLAADKLDVAVLNAGVFGPRGGGLAAPSAEDFDAVMHTNVLAPMHLIAGLARPLAAAGGKLAVLSSRMGSIGLMGSPGDWLYRSSKAALNAVLKSASLALGPQGVTCMAFHPGWVRTDMGGAQADIDAETSVTGMRRVIAAANASHNGKFLNYTGEQFEW
jgi:NAD(P)-dependent dehydrogenase (short-subunit alcohol dehydrogenase family)